MRTENTSSAAVTVTLSLNNSMRDYYLYLPGYLQMQEGKHFSLVKQISKGSTAKIWRGSLKMMNNSRTVVVKEFQGMSILQFRFEIATTQ